jgi:hypothetical protein
MDPREQHLIALRGELTRRGVRCELDDRGIWPRLRVYCPGETAGAEFDNNVVAAPVSDRWHYWWPSATPIGPVTHLTQAAETIIDELGVEEREDEDGRTNVASLAVSRMLRQARLEISRPPAPAGPTAGQSAGSVCRALAALLAELDARGMATAGMTITGLQGTLTLAGGPLWPTAAAGCSGPPAASAAEAARCMPRTVPKIRPARPGGSPCQAPGMAIDPATIPSCRPGAQDSCLDAAIHPPLRKGHPG